MAPRAADIFPRFSKVGFRGLEEKGIKFTMGEKYKDETSCQLFRAEMVSARLRIILFGENGG